MNQNRIVTSAPGGREIYHLFKNNLGLIFIVFVVLAALVMLVAVLQQGLPAASEKISAADSCTKKRIDAHLRLEGIPVTRGDLSRYARLCEETETQRAALDASAPK